MKQIVDFEQAKRLDDIGIIIDADKTIIDNNFKGLPAPTIGELIEWCYCHTGHLCFDTCGTSWRAYSVNAQRTLSCSAKESIDALVELVIKIQDAK